MTDTMSTALPPSDESTAPEVLEDGEYVIFWDGSPCGWLRCQNAPRLEEWV